MYKNRYAGGLAPFHLTEVECLERARNYESLAFCTGREDFAEAAAAYYRMAQDAHRFGKIESNRLGIYRASARQNYVASPYGTTVYSGARA